MSKRSKQKTDAIDWAKPALQQGVSNTQAAYTQSQPITQAVSKGLGDVFGAYTGRVQNGSPTLNAANDSLQATMGGQYLGANPGAGAYQRLQGATDPSLGRMSAIGDGSFVGQGADMDAMRGLLTRGTSPTGQFYSDTLSGKYLNSNPFADEALAGVMDDVSNRVNARFGASGVGFGRSTDHSGLLSRELSRTAAEARFQNYEAERARQMQAAGMADAYDLNDRGAVLAAANAYGDSERADRGQQMQALGLLSDATARQNSQQLAAAQAGDAAYGDERGRMLTAAGIAPGMAQADYAGLAPLLALAQAYQQTPFGAVQQYNQNIGALSAPYSSTTSKQSGLGNTLGTIGGLAMGAGSLMSGAGLLGGGMGALTGAGGLASGSMGLPAGFLSGGRF